MGGDGRRWEEMGYEVNPDEPETEQAWMDSGGHECEV